MKTNVISSTWLVKKSKALLGRMRRQSSGASSSASARPGVLGLRIAIALLFAAIGVMSFAAIRRLFVAPPIISTIVSGTGRTASEKSIQVNILNASGENGIAKLAMNYLRDRGFDVVEIDNYPEVLAKSMVIDRVGDTISAKRVAYALGIDDSLIAREIDSSIYLRSSIVLGRNYRKLKPFR